MKNRVVMCALAVMLASISGYFVGWQTDFGRFARGISSVAVINHSGRQLPYVSFYLFDARGEQIVRQFGPLAPEHSVVVRVRTSDLFIRRIYCDEGEKPIAYEEGGNATPGE